MRALLLLALAALTALPFTANAQWEIQTQATTADLRGIDNVGGGIAWASGSDGTVLRTEDGGYLWQRCTTPPNAEHLDFRGIQAFDANTAIVMSSGKGDLSRLYKTTDGCQTWTLLFTNPDKDGFWDDIALIPRRPRKNATATEPRGTIFILGDPINKHFVIWIVHEPLKPGQRPKRFSRGPRAYPGEGAFAASNSVMSPAAYPPILALPAGFAFVTGGTRGAHWRRLVAGLGDPQPAWKSSVIPVGSSTASSGAFSVAFRYSPGKGRIRFFAPTRYLVGVVVGGDYLKLDDPTANAAYTSDGGQHWEPPLPDAQPHGYRSAVAYDAPAETWITVGPNGTDISTDDGRNWRALLPMPGEAPDAAQHWNALSLPFAVGPHGRIGTLNPSALKPQPQPKPKP